MDKSKAIILAGYTARTNMGQNRDVRLLRKAAFASNREHWNLNTSIEHFCSEFMEGDEHYDIFMEEAQMWFATFQKLSDEEFADKWARIAKDWNATPPKRFALALQIDQGASNMVPLSRVLHESTQECLDENVAPQKDPAVRLIVHQMAHLTDLGASIDLLEYRKIVKACEEAVEANKILETQG